MEAADKTKRKEYYNLRRRITEEEYRWRKERKRREDEDYRWQKERKRRKDEDYKMRRKEEEKEQRMNERDYRPHVVCMPSIPAPTCMIPTMPSAHGMTSGVPSAASTWMIHGMTSAMPSAPTMLPMSRIQSTPSAPAGTCSVSSQCTGHSSLL